MTSISNKLIGFFFTNAKVDFLYARFICISQWILWQSVCFRCFARYHIWFSSSYFDNLRYRSQGFLIRQFLAVDNLTVGTVNTSLDSTFALDSRSRDLAGILDQFIRFFFTNAKVNFLNPSFIGISQRIFWQSVCFRCFARYHIWFSSSYFDNLRYRSQGFLIRQFLAVDNLTVGTVDTGLNRTFTLDTWSCNLTSISNKLIRFFFTNCEVNFLNPSFVGIS